MLTHPEHSNLLQFDIFVNEPDIAHFSSTRNGGVSKGEFESLNFGNYSDDDPIHINENRVILARMWYKDLAEFIIPHQVHNTRVLQIDHDFLQSSQSDKIDILYGIDATITDIPGLFLCATTADCVPILLFDKKHKTIAAIHAGWKGTVGRIVENTLLKMQQSFGTDVQAVVAAIGPAIGIDNYEIGEDVEQTFVKNNFDLSHASYRNPKTGKLHIDLKQINRKELTRLGVPEKQIEQSDLCTYDNAEMFFSARRQSVHSGRMLTGIMLK